MRQLMLLLLLGVFASWSVSAGELAPPGAPAPTMRTMQEVYDQAAQANRARGGGDALLFYPHIVEQQGSISSTPNGFDTMFVFVATGPYVESFLKGGGAPPSEKSLTDVTVSLYLYDNAGQAALSATSTPVAFPAVYTLGSMTPRVSVTLENLFQVAGGYASASFQGFAVLSVSSGDWNDVAVQAFLLNSHSSAFDLSISALEPVRVQDVAPVKSAAQKTGEGKP